MENSKKIRVIHFAHWSRSGITTLISSLAKNSHLSTALFCLLNKDADFDNFYANIPEKVQLDAEGSKISAISRFRHFLKASKPDAIHVHSLTPLIYACLLSKNIPLIFHLHCDYPYLWAKDFRSRLKQFALRWCLKRRAKKIMCVSETSAKRLHEICGLPTTYLPNGIAATGTKRSFFSENPHHYKFYSVSRLDPEKNIGHAIKLIAELNKLGIPVTYHIYGKGASLPQLEQLIKDLHINDQVRLMGFTSAPQDLPEHYDFYLSTSTQEGLSLSALQALRGRTPLITTAVGQIGLIIADNINGFIINNEFEDDLQKLQSILSLNAAQFSAIQSSAEELFAHNFTEEKFIQRMAEVYTAVYRDTLA